MGNTLKRQYRYPGQGDEPDVPLRIQQLAEDVDSDVDALDKRTTPASAAVTMHADFDVTAAGAPTVAKTGSLAVCTGRVFRKAGKTTTVIGYLPAGYLPKNVVHSGFSSRNLSTGTAGPNFHCYVDPATGSIGLTLLSGATWNETHAIPFNFAYEVAP